MKVICRAILAIGLLSSTVPANAAEIIFSGTRVNVDAAGAASARCGSRTTTHVRNDPPTATSSGLSNFGAFTPTLSHCIQLPLSGPGPFTFDLGEFLFAFENGDTLLGTYSGSISRLGPGLFSVFQTHLVTGGTGFFDDATGSFTSSGTLSFLSGRPTVDQSFSGTLSISAVPEPAAWAMLIFGFGLIGGMMRYQRPVGAKAAEGATAHQA